MARHHGNAAAPPPPPAAAEMRAASSQPAPPQRTGYQLANCSWWSDPTGSEQGGRDAKPSLRVRNHCKVARERAKRQQPLVKRINETFDTLFEKPKP